MKIKYIIVVSLFSIFGLYSCLDQDPLTSYDEKDLISSPEGFRMLVNGCYMPYLDYRYGQYYKPQMGATSTLLQSSSTMAALNANTHSSFAQNIWMQEYKMIANCNYVMYAYNKSPLAEETKRQFAGEASLLRALAYFDVVRMFGRCPLYLDKVDIDHLNIPRSSLRDVYGFILSDLRFAEQNMVNKQNQLTWHPFNTAATALKAKVFMEMACLTKEHFEACGDKDQQGFITKFGDSQTLWDSCYVNARKVYDSKDYSLVSDFSSLFGNQTKNTTESIIEFQLTDASESYSSPYSMTSLYANRLDGNNKAYSRVSSVSPYLFYEHWNNYGNGKELTYYASTSENYIKSNNEKGVDPRINASYIYYHTNPGTPNSISYSGIYGANAVTPSVLFPNATTISGTYNPYLKKSLYPGWKMYPVTSDCNIIYMRYAEVLLMLGEAANELGKTSEAVGYINEVLTRARNTSDGVPGKDGLIQPANWNSGISQDEFREKVMMERNFELIGESGDEAFDVRRRGTEFLYKRLQKNEVMYWKFLYPKAMNGYGYTVSTSGVAKFPLSGSESIVNQSFLIKNLFFPIPTSEMQYNSSITLADQNYGW